MSSQGGATFFYFEEQSVEEEEKNLSQREETKKLLAFSPWNDSLKDHQAERAKVCNINESVLLNKSIRL